VFIDSKFVLTACALAAAATASPACASEAPAGASDFTVSGSATVTSDYRFRGVSHSDRRLAVQGNIGIAHSSGLYAGLWGSSIDSDTPVNGGADEEMNFYGGYSHKFDALTLGTGWHYFFYPDHNSGHYPREHANILEGFVNAAYDFGPVTANAEVDYSPKQKSLASGLKPDEAKQDNFYVQAGLAGKIPGTPVSLSGHVGHGFGPSYLTYTEKNYTDWELKAAYSWKMLTFSASYIDTSFDNGTVRSAGSGHDLAKAGAIFAVTAAF
jgi:uncharacterized protein (TIGR02001 family)